MIKNEMAVASTSAGTIEGSYDNGLYIFKGVPYAAPPVCELRWLPPQPVRPWKGVRQAKNYGPYAPQNLREDEIIVNKYLGLVQDEDCLSLNVWTPGIDNKHRPVLVWIHGGGFQMGAGSVSEYDGARLARRGDVVVVTINYRLGVLGFLHLNEVTYGKIPATGNEGLLDQVAALEWVRDNIAGFGGAPENVTIFGESAGGISIGCLLVMPSARGLFHKAILSSGVGNIAASLKDAARIAEQFINIVGINSRDDKALRALPVQRLLSADKELDTRTTVLGGLKRLILTPVVDGKTLPELPIDAIKHGFASGTPIIVGTNLEECKLFARLEPDFQIMDEAELIRRCRYYVPHEYVDVFIKTYRKSRALRGEPTGPADIMVYIMTDATFRIAAVRVAEAQQLHQQHVYHYIMTWKTPVLDGQLGACHGLDVGLLFGTYSEDLHGSAPAAKKVSENIQDVWLAFARNGNPSCEAIGDWPPYGKRRITLMLDEKSHLEEAPYEDERRIWELVP